MPKLTADRFIDVTLDLIAEKGGSQDVNLREIARRVGCAHTNVYNYFSSFEDLMWAAFRRELKQYGEYLIRNLSNSLPPAEYMRRLITSLATYPEENPGVYRFLASDPIDLEAIPEDILISVSAMKEWLFDVLEIAFAPDLDHEAAARVSNIVLAYIDGETLNLINGRVVPGEDVRGRVIENSLQLIAELTGGGPKKPKANPGNAYPVLDLTRIERKH